LDVKTAQAYNSLNSSITCPIKDGPDKFMSDFRKKRIMNKKEESHTYF